MFAHHAVNLSPHRCSSSRRLKVRQPAPYSLLPVNHHCSTAACPANAEKVVARTKVNVGNQSEGNGYYKRSAYTDTCCGANCMEGGLVSFDKTSRFLGFGRSANLMQNSVI